MNTIGVNPDVLFSFIVDDEVDTFTWDEYLKATGTVAAPPEIFKAVRLQTFVYIAVNPGTPINNANSSQVTYDHLEWAEE